MVIQHQHQFWLGHREQLSPTRPLAPRRRERAGVGAPFGAARRRRNTVGVACANLLHSGGAQRSALVSSLLAQLLAALVLLAVVLLTAAGTSAPPTYRPGSVPSPSPQAPPR